LKIREALRKSAKIHAESHEGSASQKGSNDSQKGSDDSQKGSDDGKRPWKKKDQSTQRIEAIVLAPLRSVDWRNGRRGGGSVEAKILKGEAGKQPQALK